MLIESIVTLVRDGDTFDCADTNNPKRISRCRLVAVNAPEYPFYKYQQDTNNEKLKRHFYWGVIAKKFTESKLKSHPRIYLDYLTRDTRDRRQIVTAYLGDSSNLGLLLLQAGLARLWQNADGSYHRHFSLLPSAMQTEFTNAQATAWFNKVGFWDDGTKT